MIDLELTKQYVQALTGDVNTPIDWRLIHDQRKDLPAHNYRGTIDEISQTLIEYNGNGYGVFCTVNALDGAGRELSNVQYIRAHMVDIDNTLTAQASYERAVAAGASFAVQSSPGKYHIYWRMQPYTGNDFFTAIQRKLVQLYDGDAKVIDATRVMRVPGFLHLKGEPKLVTCWALPEINRTRTSGEIEAELQHINVIEHFNSRSPLGEESMTAPSLEWLKFAMGMLNPNDLDRGEWLSISAAIKQSAWNHATPDKILAMWEKWCAQYEFNDAGENLKLWNSINDTEVGWTSIERKTPVKAYMLFGHKTPATIKLGAAQQTQITTHPAQNNNELNQQVASGQAQISTHPVANNNQPLQDMMNNKQTADYGEILSEYECQSYFNDCYFIQQQGKIFSKGRFMNSNQFNGTYGGYNFIISTTGKLTDEAWKAALRSTCWTIPKVDHVRFLPDEPSFKIVNDTLGRPGLNTYVKPNIDAQPGDISRFHDWLFKILPNENDRRILVEYMAHAVKYPGFKIPWAPMLQSTPGIGKTAFKYIMSHSLGDMYVYSPKAPELVESGSTFNAWQRAKLMIMVDEIKIDERRELIEILKPMITDNRIEIQSKGVDQDMEDNTANWFFFSNYKDAVPINKRTRRYGIFYSALQSAEDIYNAGMGTDENSEWFKSFFDWLEIEGGLQAIAHYLLTYPIERGAIPMRAPKTSSYDEAIAISRSPLEVIILDAVTDELPGFRGGYISTLACIKKAKETGIRSPNTRTVQNCLEGMGFALVGRSVRPYMQESVNNRTVLYGTTSGLIVENYGIAQGYE